MDLSAFGESLRRGLSEIPPIVLALALLAGPTAALIGYRLIGVARRMQTSPEVEAVPRWVCQDCRSVNELRVTRCYRCGVEHGAESEIEIVVDQPETRPRPLHVPEGSPFAAVAMGDKPQSGIPVMTNRATDDRRVAVGPGRDVEPAPAITGDGAADLVESDR